MSNKGFVNIIIAIVGVVVLAGVASYFILNQRTPLPTPAPSSIPGYPATVYIPLTMAERAAEEKSFSARNGSMWKLIGIDDYGFIDVLSTDDKVLLAKYKVTEGREIDVAAAVEAYRQFVLKNADFFGIDTPGSLKLERAADALALEAEQKIAGMFFIYTYGHPYSAQIAITHTENNITITGHFWPKASVPTIPKFSADQLKKKLVGMQYTYQPPVNEFMSPQASGPRTITITEAISQKAQGVLGPYFWKNPETKKLELRLGYTFGLPYNSSVTTDIPPTLLIVDAITGEAVKLPQ